MEIDPLTVALIKVLNSGSRDPYFHESSDLGLMLDYGSKVQPVTDAIREAIREEVLRLSQT